MDPFTEEQKVQMKEILNFADGPDKEDIEEDKYIDYKKKGKTDSTKTSKKKKGGFIVPDNWKDENGKIGDYYHQYIKDTKSKKKTKRLTTESSSELSDSTNQRYSKSK